MPHTIKNVECVYDSGKALKCKVELGDASMEFWIPQSQIHEDSEVYEEGGEGDLIITDWYMDKHPELAELIDDLNED